MVEAIRSGQSNSVLLHEPATQRWLWFHRPVQVCVAHSANSVPAVLHEVQRAVQERSLCAAGFLAYEAAPGLDPAFEVQNAGGFPLAWFGLYERYEPIPLPILDSDSAKAIPWGSSVTEEEYHLAMHQIREFIRAGDTYQVNYSLRLRAPFPGDPWGLFARMVQAQGPHYAAFINLPDWTICCASPELFFRLHGSEIVCRPMKGTARRGLWPEQDQAQAAELRRSEKNRAENVMIVDMVRNDLGRIAQTGSIRVDPLFKIEKYPTVWQMTSTVHATTDAEFPEIMAALFPAASITGAPKVRTMQIIAGLEKSPRRIYTGTIGFLAPHREAQFNVAIRTVLIDKRQQQAEYGVGGGIVWDSSPAEEFEECQLKAKVLTTVLPDFALLETILWSPCSADFQSAGLVGRGVPAEPWRCFSLLDAHLQRLQASANYFSRTIPLEEIRDALSKLSQTLPDQPQRIRLLVYDTGKFDLESQPLVPLRQPYRIRLAPAPVNSQDLFLYHKTSHRQVYEQALAPCPGHDDVLLWNEREELTETTIANLIVEKHGQWLTPPIQCGLLPGVYRDYLVQQQRVKEQVLRVADLAQADKILLMNSVRGIWEATGLIP